MVDEPGNNMTDMSPKSRLKKALRTPAPVRPLKERATFGRCDVSQGVGDRQARASTLSQRLSTPFRVN